jgi:hypothetical protein
VQLGPVQALMHVQEHPVVVEPETALPRPLQASNVQAGEQTG